MKIIQSILVKVNPSSSLFNKVLCEKRANLRNMLNQYMSGLLENRIECLTSSIQEFYNDLVSREDLLFYKCTNQNCCHRGFHYHGCYEKYINLGCVLIPITIQRIKCPSCSKTHALIPADLILYRQLHFTVLLKILNSFNQDNTLDQLMNDYCCLSSSYIHSIHQSWKLHWKERIQSKNIDLSQDYIRLNHICLKYGK